MADKKIMVTGATSFIGNALIRQLLKNDVFEIFAICNPGSLRKNNICKSERVKIVECDLADIDRLEAIESADIVFHIGWSSQFENPRYNLEGQMQNVDYLEKVIRLAARLKCKKVLGVGSQAECGRVSAPISELTLSHPETAYAVAKCISFENGMELCSRYGIDFYWPRLLSSYGPGDKKHTMIMSCLDAAIHQKKIEFTKCEQIWDYIYVDDVADALIAIVSAGTPGVKYTIASGKGKKLKDYILEIARITDNTLLMDGIGKRAYASGQVMHLAGNIEKLKMDTGFAPKICFREGILKTIADDFRVKAGE